MSGTYSERGTYMPINTVHRNLMIGYLGPFLNARPNRFRRGSERDVGRHLSD
jgi:hypothetical protein